MGVTFAPAPTVVPAPASHDPDDGTDSTARGTTAKRVQAVRDVRALPPFQPDLFQRGWSSVPHPTLPLLATAHHKSVTVFSLSDFTAHSSLTGGHDRSVRTVTWRPALAPNKLCLVTGSFDSTAGLWRYEQPGDAAAREQEIRLGADGDDDHDDDRDKDAWEFTLVLEGQEHEIKSVAFAPSGQFLATCSRDKSVWIWEDVGADDDDDEWETVAVLNEHEGDVKCVAWCPDVPGRRLGAGASSRYSLDVLASTSYDNTTRIWREDGDGEWVCVAVLEGHEGTVWGVQWEADPLRTRFPRLLTWSADQTLRVWEMDEGDEAEGGDGEGGGDSTAKGAFGFVPNTMRSLHEAWTCTAILPRAHTRDIYSATWSATTGLVASTGSDGTVVVYAEVDGPGDDMADANAGRSRPSSSKTSHAHSACSHEHGHEHEHGHSHEHEHKHKHVPTKTTHWEIVGSVAAAHGPYEVNNVTWCRRFDAGTERRGEEEMLVTTGDDGVVRPWQVVV